MKFDVYGRFKIEVRWESDRWVAYRISAGTRARVDIAIPQEIQKSEEIAQYLDDLYHEAAGPGQTVSEISE